MHFSWNPTKARINERKHGVTFVEATTVFADPFALVVEEGASVGRLVILGRSLAARTLCVVFVELDGDSVRLISARSATRREREAYEEGDGT